MNREDLQRENLVRLFQLSNAIQTYIDRLLKEFKLTTKQFFMMIIIGSFEYEPRIGEVSERFMTSHQNVKQVLLKLQKAGYVELFQDPQDARIKRVRLTSFALSFWQARDEQDNVSMNDMFSVLSISELQTMKDAFLKLSKKMEELNK
jgi:DNA-binding MarR family transcriptional regulator